MFESVMRLWNESSEEGGYQKPHIERKWEALRTAIETGQKRPALRKNKRLFTKWRVAAAFLVLLGIAAFLYLQRPRDEQAVYHKVIRSEGNIVHYTLRDSTTISLFRNSRLSIQDQFAVTGRKVKLEGQSYFSVKRSRGRPFIIYTGGIKIMVLGTSFNVKDYPESISVGVREGAVKMQKDSLSMVVKAGSTGIFYKKDLRFVLYADSLNRNAYSYATGALYFNNTSMREVKTALEHTYGITVMFKDDSLAYQRIHTYFKRQSLDYVAKIISASLGIQYYFKDDTLYFYKQKIQ